MRHQAPTAHPITAWGIAQKRINPISSAKGALHHSLGHRPRNQSLRKALHRSAEGRSKAAGATTKLPSFAPPQLLPSTHRMSDQKNKLYYGDNLEVLRDYIPDQSVDLIDLDPPFNSRQDYNVLFAYK